MEFWKRLVDLFASYPKVLGAVILSPKNHLQQTNLRQGYAKRSARDELGAPDVKRPCWASTEQSRNAGGEFLLPSSQVHSPRSSATASDEVVVEDLGESPAWDSWQVSRWWLALQGDAIHYCSSKDSDSLRKIARGPPWSLTL